jgi:hypothetical protein
MEVFLGSMILLVGFALGYLSKGITININKTPEIEVDEEGKPKYNDSLAHLLPKEIQDYYKQNEGQNKF